MITVVALGLIAAGAGGYLLGIRTERIARQPAIDDAQTSKTLIVIRRDILLLTEMRQKKYLDLIKDNELWTLTQLQQIDPSKFVKGSVSDYLHPQTMEMVNAYRKQFPDTMLNPDKDPTIAKAFVRAQ